jgi:CRISPR-associated protein (TIGR02710 family)
MMNEPESCIEELRLLICSVGGAPEPVVTSLLHWNPARVLFVPSEQTRPQIDPILRAYADAAGTPLGPGQYAIRPVPDAEDLLGSVRSIKGLTSEVTDWISRQGGNYRVIVDFTAATKCMTAALALVSRHWPCRYSYVGGERRTKGGVGVVETGAERVVYSANPWDAFGYQAVDEAVVVFDHGGYPAAAALLDQAVKNAQLPEVKRELSTLKGVIDGYAAWDRFDHKTAAQRFDEALKNRNDLLAIFAHGSSVVERLEQDRGQVARLLAAQNEITLELVRDLILNARRRARERRFDDAVARLYRAYEALAQVRLRVQYGIAETKAVPLERVPEALRLEWGARAREDCIMLGLQDAYRVLRDLGDPLGRRFFELGMGDEHRSPLVARNGSILAHGFQPVGERVYTVLNEKLCALLLLGEIEPHAWRLSAPAGPSSLHRPPAR